MLKVKFLTVLCCGVLTRTLSSSKLTSLLKSFNYTAVQNYGRQSRETALAPVVLTVRYLASLPHPINLSPGLPPFC